MIFCIAILLAIIFAQLGCVILWQRYTYFGDGLVHACIFSGSLSLLFSLSPIITIAITAILYGALVNYISRRSETNIAINLSSSMMLALALIVNSLFGDINSLNQLLVGDMLFTNIEDVKILMIIATITAIVMSVFYKKIILLSLSPELAQIHGINIKRYKWAIFITIGLIITTTIPMVGGLLCTAMLIIPAATARLLSASPKQMILLSIVIAGMTNIVGVILAFQFNLPISPIILIVASALYLTLYTTKINNNSLANLRSRIRHNPKL